MNKIKNFCANCEAWCCYDGVYLTKQDELKINKVVLNNKTFFSFLPPDYIVDGSWEGIMSGRKTNVKPKQYKLKNYPKHFNNTCCVFLVDNKCMLEEFAVKNNEQPWKYKPHTCCLFPLQKHGKGYVIPSKTADSCNIGEHYPGYVSCLPCYKLTETDLQKEIEFANRTKKE